MKRAAENTRPAPQLRFTKSGVYWLLVALFVGAIAWYKSINVVMIIVYAMIALLVINGFLAWRNVRPASAKRLTIPPLFAGERSEFGVIVSNAANRAITVTAADRLPSGTTHFLAYRVPAQRSLTCTAAQVFAKRGRYSGPLALVSGFPFGFLECELATDSGGEIVVLPRPGVAEPDGLRRWIARQEGNDGKARKVLRRLTSDRAEVRAVRAYRTGDAIRDIHWRSTARRGEPMVREYDSAPSPELLLVVEAWLPEKPQPADYARVEAALSLAVTIAITWRRAIDSPVTIVTTEPTPVLATGYSDEDLREALKPLAEVRGGPMPDAISAAVFAGRLSRSARVVVSSRENTPYASVLSRATGKPFAAVSPGDRLPWYQPPAA
jgi:uncharacterized protein (DUF58 family)